MQLFEIDVTEINEQLLVLGEGVKRKEVLGV